MHSIERAADPLRTSLDFFVKMFANLFRDIVVQATAREQLFQPSHNPLDRIDAKSTNISFIPSFVSQRNHRIDAGGAAGWHETSDQSDGN